ncbi:MAG: DUF1844 domain-containing protein [Opitutaceae bacterium]|nr:DUF1844 domain-containing protein [Verrucomicrobiales bacterium]
MNRQPEVDEASLANADRDEIMSALFASMVMQQSQMAFMLLGQAPHPDSGEVIRDVEGAKMFIDQLEVIEFKTRGNLSADEASLLKQSLSALRMAFVQAIDRPVVDPVSTGGQSLPSGDVKVSDFGEDSGRRSTKKY